MKNVAGQENTVANAGMKINIQNMRIIYRGDTNVKASMSAVIGGAYAVHGIKVIAGPKGDFVSLPSVKGADGEYRDVFHPITAEARAELFNGVMAAYKAELEKSQSKEQTAGQEEDSATEEQESDPEEGPCMKM